MVLPHALAPARDKIDPETFGKLSRALTLLLGIDPVVVMKDIAGDSQEGRSTLWNGAHERSSAQHSLAERRPLAPPKHRWRKGGLPQPCPRVRGNSGRLDPLPNKRRSTLRGKFMNQFTLKDV